jgi:Ca2+-binding RTX toxin-like protein
MEGLPEKKEKQMRRTIALLTMVAMTLLVATSVAMAAVITCPTANNPPGSPPGTCRGTPNADTMTGTNGTFNAPGENYNGDIIDGFRGGDTLNARKANDTLNGGNGEDTLNGGQGNDILDGGEGNDTYLFEDGWGEDTITGDASGNDTLDFSKLAYEQDVNVKMVPSSSNNEATSGTNTLNWDFPVPIERIIGGAGRDALFGSNVGDSLYGAEARDILYGGSGNDTIVGGDGQDILHGGSGDDTITATDNRPVGGPETIISCGDGRDTVIYDREFESPDRDCEIRIGLPAIAPPTN